MIRPAAVADLPGVAAIYGHALRTSVAALDVADPPSSYWREKLDSDETGDHLLVVEQEHERTS